MSDFIILTDSSADLPDTYTKEHDITVVSLSYFINGETYGDNKKLDTKVFYEKLRNGEEATTSQVNPEQAMNAILEASKRCKNILFIAFSSGLSGTYQSIKIAIDDLSDSNPEINVHVVDSLSGSLGQGLLVHKAVMKRDNGASLEETIEYIEELKLHICHIFTVEDLNFLQRGGRIGKGTAIFGSMINIKPILITDNEGHLVSNDKTRGRKKSLITLVDKMESLMGSYKNDNDIIFISHADSEEDAKVVGEEVKNRFGIENIMYGDIGPVIGSHSGPGTVALFFVGENR